ncbi:MAG: class I SAM-dependent methyltransferase [Firmicutes bacterium]|nr:class I SAM-dependent methyltransferase [Bacillota bacterium]
MRSLYNHPKYYDLAFSYRNITSEVDTIEKCIKIYSKVPVQTVLELGCGSCPHMLEIVKRGYTYVGIDINPRMIQYSLEKAYNHQDKVKLVQASMVDFELDHQVDFVCTMLGSLYVQNTEQLISHFHSVSKILKSGGLYFLDWCVDFSPLTDVSDYWTTEDSLLNIFTEVNYRLRLHNIVEQLYTETVDVKVTENGRVRKFRESHLRRAIYPQEFVLASTKLSPFELVGWWNNWNLNKPLTGKERNVRPMILLRRL